MTKIRPDRSNTKVVGAEVKKTKDNKSGVFVPTDAQIAEVYGSEFSMFDIAWGPGWDIEGAFEYADVMGIEDFRKMLDKDGKARSLEAALTAPVMGAQWHIEPAEADKGEAEFVDHYLRQAWLAGGMKTAFQDVIGQATSARTFRKAFFEKTYKQGSGEFEGKIVYDNLAFRPPETCETWRDDRTGAFKGFRQKPIRKSAVITTEDVKDIVFHPPYCWVHINGQHRNPLSGVSDMQVPLWCFKTKQRVLWLWTVFLTTQAEPRTLVQSGDHESAAKQVAKLKGGGTVGVNTGTDVEVLESSGQGAKAFQEFIAYLDNQMLASNLAGFLDLTSPTQGTGSFALSKDQSAFFEMAEERFMKELADSITRNIVGDLVLINFGPDAAFPTFTFEPSGQSGMTEMMTLLTSRSADLPFEFFQELTKKVANVLDLDEDVVNEALEKAGEIAEQKVQMGLEMQNQQIAMGGAAPGAGAPGKPAGPAAAGKVANAAGRVAKAAEMVKDKVPSNRQQAKAKGLATSKALAPKLPKPKVS